MSTASGDTHGPGESAPHAPGTSDPGLEHLIKALTANGHPYERNGRDAALAAFRAASAQHGRAYRGSRRVARSWRFPMPVRTVAVAVAGITVLGILTAAAYTQALPASFQRIAHSMLAPLGVPGTQQRSADETPSLQDTPGYGQMLPTAGTAPTAIDAPARPTATSDPATGSPAAPAGLSVQLQVTLGLATDHFIATISAPSGSPHGIVLLTELVNGTWQTVASRSPGAATRINFRVSASSASGQVFRAELSYPGTVIASDSNSVSVPGGTSHPGK